MLDDATLLRRFADAKSGDAFAELVQRHLPVVYAAALRRLGGDTHRAEDVAQAVFCALARHAHRLKHHPTLVGWLYTATRHEVLNVIRAERRRRAREEEAHTMFQNDADSPADWSQLRPVLDTAMDRLGDRDREAVLLRFFQGRPFAEIGAIVGLSEEAARKRVDRALDKLRAALPARGITSTSAALAALLANQAVAAVPASLATQIAGTAATTGAAGGSAFLSLLAMSKAKTAVAALLVLAGGVGFVVQQRTIAGLRHEHAAARHELARLQQANAALAQSHADAQAESAALRQKLETARPPAPPHRETAQAIALPAAASTSPTPAHRETKARLHRRYDPFLQKFGLTAAQADRFVELKLAIYEAQDDLQAAVRQAGVQGGTSSVEAMRSQLVTPLWDEIRQLLGPEGYAAYGEYEHMSAVHGGYIEPMTPLFAAIDAPLSPQQTESLIRLVIANRQSYRAQPTDISTRSRIDWSAVVQQARPLLTPAQLSVLQSHTRRLSEKP